MKVKYNKQVFIQIWHNSIVVILSSRHMGRKTVSMYLKRSGINCRSRVLYTGSGFLSSVTWPLMQKKHFNGFIIIIIIKNT